LAPIFTGPGEIIDINDTNAKVKINNKIKILNVNKIKLFLQNKNAAKLALLMLKEESGYSDFETIDSLCSEPCPSCDIENYRTQQ
jgi:hypothetical protein